MQSFTRVVRVLAAAFIAALPTAGTGCGSAPSTATEAGSQLAPSSGKIQEETSPGLSSLSPVESTPAQPVTGGDGIRASTLRTAAGLPEPLPDYLSWTPLVCAAPLTSSQSAGHRPLVQAYASFPKAEIAGPPYPAGTICVLEEKEPGKSFIDRVSVLAKADEGWRFSAYARHQSSEPFTAVSGVTSSQCSACHAAGKDSVFSHATR